MNNVITRGVGFLAGMAVSLSAFSADFYVTAGISKAQLRHPGTNKWWIQEGWAYQIDSTSAGWTLGAGWKINKYLSVETAYHDLGQYHEFAGFMWAEDHYSPVTANHCVNGCAPTVWGYLDGSASAVSLSVLPRLPVTKNLSFYGRLGLERHRAKFSLKVAPSDTTSRDFADVSGSYTQTGTGRIYGLGITYMNLSVELQQLDSVYVDLGIAGGSPYTQARALNVSYKWEF